MIRIVLNGEIFLEDYVSWQEVNSVISRSKDYHGVIISQNLDIRLIQSAYDFVDNLDNIYDVAAVCTCVIQSHTSVNGWKDEFSGILDFTTLKRDNKGATRGLTINAYSNDFANKLIERSDIEIPYDRLTGLDDNVITPFTNEYQSVDIIGAEVITTESGSFEIMELLAPAGYVDYIWPTIDFEGNNVNMFNTLIFGDCDSTRFDSSIFSYYADGVYSIISLKLQLTYFYNTPNTLLPPSTFKILKVRKLPEGETNFFGKDIEIASISTMYTQTIYGVSATPTYSYIDIDQDFIVEDGYGLYFQFSRVEGSCFGGVMEITENPLTDLIISEKAPVTPCNFVPPFEWGQRIIENITGQSNGLDSPIFGRTDSPTVYATDGEGALIFGTNGKLIRQFPTGYITTDSEKKSQLSASFKDWFENYDKVLCLGAGVKYEDGQYKLYVDDRKEFYKNELVYEIEELEVKSFESEKLSELYFNEIEIGSVYAIPEEIGANEEYNSKQKYSTPILNENKLDLISKWIYAAYPVEAARRMDFLNTETEDYRYDKNNFMFQVYRDGGFVQYSAQDFIEINGLEGLTTYINLTITPQRILRERFGWLLNTGFKGYQDKSLKYNVSDIVTDLSTLKTGDINLITENSDIEISSLESPKFTGKRIRFSAPVSSDTFDLLQANPYGIIKYPNPLTGVDGYMYLDEVSTTLIDKKTNWEGREITGFSEVGYFRLLQDGAYRLLESGGRRLLE